MSLHRNGKLIAFWQEGRPDAGFYHILNSEVRRWAAVNDRQLVIEFENGIEMHLEDDSDQYECILIGVSGRDALLTKNCWQIDDNLV